EVEGALLDGPDQLLVQVGHRAGHQHHLGTGTDRPDGTRHLETVDPGHPHVDDRDVERLAPDRLDGLGAGGAAAHLVPRRQDALDGPEHRRVVVHDQDARRPALHASALAAADGAVLPTPRAAPLSSCPSFRATGSVTATTVPLPGWLSMLMSPPFSHRIDRQIARPNPNPSV